MHGDARTLPDGVDRRHAQHGRPSVEHDPRCHAGSSLDCCPGVYPLPFAMRPLAEALRGGRTGASGLRCEALAGTDNVSDAVHPVQDGTGLWQPAPNRCLETKRRKIKEIDRLAREKACASVRAVLWHRFC